MSLIAFLGQAVDRIEEKNLKYALAGGLAVSLYRAEERSTKDLDFAISAGKDTAVIAEEIIRSFGLSPSIARKADLDGGPLFAIKKKSTPACIIVGRDKNDKTAIGLDFILSELPWVPGALERAQQNRIDFGFRIIPTLTVEDVIIAKLTAVRPANRREKDIDDLRSIFAAQGKIDIAQLTGQMEALRLEVPNEIIKDVPDSVRRTAKKIAKELKLERENSRKRFR